MKRVCIVCIIVCMCSYAYMSEYSRQVVEDTGKREYISIRESVNNV